MITVISGTNRKGNETQHFAKHLYNLLVEKTNVEVKFLDLQNIPNDCLHIDMYNAENQSSSLAAIQDEFILPAQKIVFVTPEYNGSFPGVVKMFIDACSIRNYADNFQGKKAALLGTAAGRAGNLRGMEHLTGVLNYLGATVMPNRLPLSAVSSLLNEQKQIIDEETLKVMDNFANSIIEF